MSDAKTPTPQQEAQTWGEALRRLRENSRDASGRKLTQDAAARAYGVKRQAWNNYEQGERLVILQADVRERLVEAIGRTVEDLERYRAEVMGAAYRAPHQEGRSFGGGERSYELSVLGRVEASPTGPQVVDANGEPESVVDVSWLFGPTARLMRAAGDSMTGYVESGELVAYDVKLWPRRGEGCVVELRNGELYIKEYLEHAQGVLKVRQLFPEDTISFPMADVKGVYKVRLRGIL